jgi:hypothetical protein
MSFFVNISNIGQVFQASGGYFYNSSFKSDSSASIIFNAAGADAYLQHQNTNMSWKIVILLIILVLHSVINIFAQHEISGIVTEKNGDPVPGANIFIEGTFDGCSSDSLGSFSFTTNADSIQTLIDHVLKVLEAQNVF